MCFRPPEKAGGFFLVIYVYLLLFMLTNLENKTIRYNFAVITNHHPEKTTKYYPLSQ